jgi:HEAT repeat protein
MRTVILLLALAVLLGCGTPKVAEEYKAETYLPDQLRAALADDDPSRRADAAEQVEKMEPKRRRLVLLELSGDERSEVRLLAVSLLERLHSGDEEVVKRLAGILAHDPDPDIRTAAVGALSASGRPEALDALLDALMNDTSLSVRKDIASALDRLTGQSFGGDLVTAVDSAEEAADEAVMNYDEWIEMNRDRLKWDAKQERFVRPEKPAED